MLDDVRFRAALSAAKEAQINASCVCGCGCNCTCVCSCQFFVNQQANWQASGNNNNQTKLQNRWYSNGVSGQGP